MCHKSGSAAQGVGHLAQHFVAGDMAVGVVEELEVVQVQHDHGQRAALTLGTVGFLFQTLVKGPVVPEPCQRVPVRPVYASASSRSRSVSTCRRAVTS